MTKRLRRQGKIPKTGIVHLGPGAFFRAFNAVFTHDAMEAAGGDWGIAAISLRSRDVCDALNDQDGAFTSMTLTPDGGDARVIGSVTQALFAPDDPGAVVALMADPATRIVSLTITEKGYCHDPATGRLNLSHPDIAHDLLHPDRPKSAIGFLVAALAERRASGGLPFTVLSCDNLPSNGALTRAVTLDFARQRDPDLSAWIADQVPFLSTMVDRITPATTDEDLARLEAKQGYTDNAAVFHESFRQWVIEDTFTAGRPEWDKAGAKFVEDVARHEHMKLRCLNGTHSSLAYLGYLAGFETVAEASNDETLAAFCRALWRDEIVPTVPPPDGEDLRAYCDQLLARYRDPSIRHRLWQIAMDGSQKLPQRILGTISDGLAAGQSQSGLCLAVAAWMRYVGGVDEQGIPIDVRDPMASQLRDAASTDDPVSALLNVGEIFPTVLSRNSVFRDQVTAWHETLRTVGARNAVARYLAPEAP